MLEMYIVFDVQFRGFFLEFCNVFIFKRIFEDIS